MSDILKITTPIVPKNYVNPNSKMLQGQDTQGFNLVDLTKVIKPNSKEEFANPNLLFSKKQALAEKFFFNLIKDPGLAASSLKTFFETYGKLSPGELADTKDINVENFVRLSKALGLDYNGLLTEMKVQSDGISLFKGEFFDLLRTVYTQQPEDAIKDLIVPLLKAISINHANNDVYGSLLENVKNLVKEFPPQALFSIKLQNIVNTMRFISPNSSTWQADFEGMKNQLITLLKEINISPFNSNRIEDATALIIYNLSFLNSGGADPKEALNKLLTKVKDKQLADLLFGGFQRFMAKRSDPLQAPPRNSELIDSIAAFVKVFQKAGKTSITDNADINNILRSLIAAPNSFTPLLHFILPLKHEDTQAFAELWVDPYEENQDENEDDKIIHLFFVIDIIDIGYFEVEMSLVNTSLNLAVLCPEQHLEAFAPLKDSIERAVAQTPYTLEHLLLDKLVKPRKLTQVFPKLMQKRDGFDVKA